MLFRKFRAGFAAVFAGVQLIALVRGENTVTIPNDHPLIFFHGRWDASPGTWWCVAINSSLHPTGDLLMIVIQDWKRIQAKRPGAFVVEPEPWEPHDSAPRLCRRLGQLRGLRHREPHGGPE